MDVDAINITVEFMHCLSASAGEVAKGELWRVFHRLDACQSSARLCRICSKVKYGNFFCLFILFYFLVAIYKTSQSSTFVAGSLCPFICTLPCHKTLCERVVMLVEQYCETLCASKTLCAKLAQYHKTLCESMIMSVEQYHKTGVKGLV